jgi:hypothetical protein
MNYILSFTIIMLVIIAIDDLKGRQMQPTPRQIKGLFARKSNVTLSEHRN